VAQSSAQLKLARGVKHVYTLREEARTFENSDAYVPNVERNVRSAKEIEYKVTAIENLRPKEDWPLLAGEAIQNLRSALDHAVYALAKKNRSKSQFPIFTDPCEFQVKGRPLIAGVPSPVRALMERRQPYNRFPQNPARDSLAILNRLSNHDKHRTLTTLATAVRFQYIGLGEGVRVEALAPFSEGQPLHYGAHIAHFIARSTTEIREKDVAPRFSYEVRIEGLPLGSTLTAIAQRVFEAVEECETGAPVPPGAQYPIYPN
jgi:hypothetical protein